MKKLEKIDKTFIIFGAVGIVFMASAVVFNIVCGNWLNAITTVLWIASLVVLITDTKIRVGLREKNYELQDLVRKLRYENKAYKERQFPWHKLTNKELHDKAVEVIKEIGPMINEFLRIQDSMDEEQKRTFWRHRRIADAKAAFRWYNAAHHVVFYTSDNPIEMKRFSHRNIVEKMRRLGLHKMAILK